MIDVNSGEEIYYKYNSLNRIQTKCIMILSDTHMDGIGTDRLTCEKQDANARTGEYSINLKRTWHLKAPFEMLLDEKKKEKRNK